MHELVYVLTVESFVFGLLGVLLVAQRWDVFQWPEGRAWPVFSTCLVVIFGYSQILLALCCGIAIGRFGALTHSLMDACARSAGRLVTSAVLTVCYVAALLIISHRTQLQGQQAGQSMQCMLMQLCGTSCAPGSAETFSMFEGTAHDITLVNVIINFLQLFVLGTAQHVYFAVLLPVWALVAALLVTAAGMCKDEQRSSRGRLLCINIAYMLAYHVNYMLRMNVRCQQACSGAVVTHPTELIICKEALFLAGALCVSDIFAETVLVRHTILRLHAGRGRGKLPNIEKYMIMRISGVFVFGILRLAQVLAVLVFNWLAESQLQLPWQLMVVHVSLASVLCLLDIVQVVIEYTHAQKVSVELADSKLAAQQTGFKQGSDAVEEALPRSLKAFEVDPKSRKKFMMTFTGKTRWPAVLNVATTKKST
jgi:hypothetical protein